MTYLNKINNHSDIYLNSDVIDFESLDSIDFLVTKVEKVITTLLKPLSKPSNQQKTILHEKTIDSILSIKGKPLNSLETLATKVKKVIKNCFNQLPKLFEQFKTTLSAKTIDPIVSLKNKVLSSLETLAAKVESVFEGIKASSDDIHKSNIDKLKAADPSLSEEQAEEILDYGKFVTSFSTPYLYDWGESLPTSEIKIEGSHVMKGAHDVFIVERKEIDKGGGKIVNKALIAKVDLFGRMTFEQVAVMRPIYRPKSEDILEREQYVQSLGLANNHLESKALYTGRAFDMARNLFDDSVPRVTDFMVKPYLNRLSQLTTVNNKLQAMLDIAKSINYLHKHDLVHRDIKPENMMYTNKSNGKISAKLIDLGQLHNINNESENTFQGTESYIAPEIQASKIHTKASDMYAFGLTIQRVIEPLKNSSTSPVLNQMENLAQRLISEDLEMRPTAEETYKELKSIKINNYS